MTTTPERSARLLDPSHRMLLVGIVCLVTVVAMESMAVTTVMPIVEEDLGDLWLYGWVFSAFYLGTLIGVVTGGRAVDRVRPVGPMVAGVVIFLAGLTVGGLASDMGVLVLGRFLQGLGAGVVPAVAYVCVGRGFPPALRPRVFAVMSTAWVLPALLSPMIASEVAERFGWRWVFLGLIPVTVVVAAIGLPSISTVVTPERGDDHPSTPYGRVLLLAAGAALVLGGLGTDRLVIGLPIAAAGVALALPAFVRLTPPGTLRARPALPAAVLTRGVITYAFFSADAFVSLALTSVRGTSTRTAGFVLAAASVTWTAGSWAQARFSDHWGATRLVRTGGLSLVLGAVSMVCCLNSAVPIWGWVFAGCASGLGMGLAYPQLSIVTLAEADPGHEGAATSALQMSDILGIALGTGFAGVIVSIGDRFWSDAWIALALVFGVAALFGAAVALLAPRLTRAPGSSTDRVSSTRSPA